MNTLKDSLIQHKHVIWALFNREITTKIGDSYFGYALLLLEPLLYVMALAGLFYLMGRNTGSMPIILFLLTGIIPYLYLRKAIGSCSGAISANKTLLSYKQVKMIDTLIARLLLESTISFVITIVCCLILLYLGEWIPVIQPLRIIFMTLQLIMITVGLGLFVAIIGYYYIDLKTFIGLVFRVLFYTSGIFFGINELPLKIQYYISFNPLLQIIEIIRSAFNGQSMNIYLSYEYTTFCSIICLFLGLAMYFIARRNILMNSRAR